MLVLIVRNLTLECGDFNKVALDPRVHDRAVCFGARTNLEEQVEPLAFLDKNNDIFV
jgi:hypothetical protein